MDEVVVCRCENVTLGDLKRAVEAFEPTSLRQLKLVTRWGMGICQGRTCRVAGALSHLESEGISPRPPFKPVGLEDWAEGRDS